MIAEILTVGDELCRGEIVDTNSSWLASELWDLGVTVGWMTSCRDVQQDVERAAREAVGRAQLVICTGGLGPTTDDLTVDALSAVAGVEPVVDEPSLERMKARFERAGYALTPNNLRQVRIPRGAVVHANPAGLAPGFELSVGGATVAALPGVPRELHAIWAASLRDRVLGLVAAYDRIARRVWRVFGVGESHIDHKLAGLTDGVAGASIHYQVVFPETLVKLVVRDPDRAAAQARVDAMAAELERRLGPVAYADGHDSMAAVLGRALVRRGATLAVAESCTGGLVGALVTEVPGSSGWFLGGTIAYDNRLKVRELGVPEEILARDGAVSEACVGAMARGVVARTGATLGAAVSGIAGPGGGTDEKPVGTVHVAVADASGVLAHKRFVFPGARDAVRRIAAFWAMSMVLRCCGG